MRKYFGCVLCVCLFTLSFGIAYPQTYEEYRETWEGKQRARFITYRYDRPDLDFKDAGYVSDMPLEWSHNLGGTGENQLVDPFNYEDSSDMRAKHVLLMVHGYGAPFGEGYFESREPFSTESVAHETGATAWYYDASGPSLYDYLRESAPTDGFDPDEWVVLGVTLNISQGSGLSILENQKRLRALVDLLWYHKQDKILTISFASHSTGSPVVKGVLGGTDPEEHPWIDVVDDHINLAGALGGTGFVYADAPAAAGAPHLRHQLMYGIQHADDYTGDYKYHAGTTAANGKFKKTYRWPEHVNVLSVAGVWGGPVDGDPMSGDIIGNIPWNITNSIVDMVHVYDGKTDGIVPNTSVIEHVYYKLSGDEFEWKAQVAESDRYYIEHDGAWVLPSLQPSGTAAFPYAAGAGTLAPGASSNADNVPAADEYRGQAMTYVEVEAQHNGMLHNEHLLRLVRRRLGTWTIEPNVTRPVVSGLSPDDGPTTGGNTTQIHGEGFEYVTGIRFGDVYVGQPVVAGTPPDWTVESETQITVPVPEAVPRLEGDTEPYVVDVQVINTAGSSEDNGVLDDYQYLFPLEPPSIDPPGGTFETPVDVALSTETEGTTIYYTLNGSEPGPDNTTANVYAAPVTVSPSPGDEVTSVTLKARSVKGGYLNSDVSEAVFAVDARVEAPNIIPEGGDFTGSAGITLASNTPGASIYYTTDGNEPTYNSTQYTGQFQLGVGEHTVKARAYQVGYNASPVSEASFRIYATSDERTADPVLYPLGSGNFTDSVYVRMLDHTEGAMIRYTIGQNEAPDVPTEQSTAYTEPFTLKYDDSDGQDETTWFIRAKAFADELPQSNMIQRSYAVSPALGETAAPQYEPGAGTYFNEMDVSISSATQGAQLYVTIDGSPAVYDPDLESESLPHSLTLNGTTELRSVAKRPFFSTSEETVEKFVFETAPGEIAADATTDASDASEMTAYVDSVRVSLTSETDGASIHYTLDGSEPNQMSTEYENPFYLSESATVTTRAFKSDYLHSEIVSRTFSVQASEAPIVIRDPESVEAVIGSEVVFRVTAEGRPPPDYQWMHDRNQIRRATADSLVLSNIRAEDAGSYHVVLKNTAGEARSRIATLDVLPRTAMPEISSHPSNRTAAIGALTTFSISASGRPEPSYQWLKDGEPIPKATSSDLVLSAIRADDEASYRAIASNAAGADTSLAATLTVTPSTAPTITRQPPAVNVHAGDTARFEVEASGKPTPNYRWLWNEEPLPGETADTLVIPDVQPEDAGTYAVIVYNLAGTDTSEVAVLTVDASVTVEAGEDVPERFALRANYPNPFNPATTIAFDLPRDGRVTLTVYNQLGQRVAILYDGPLPPGRYEKRHDFSRLASGVYLYEMRVDGPTSQYHEVKAFVLLK